MTDDTCGLLNATDPMGPRAVAFDVGFYDHSVVDRTEGTVNPCDGDDVTAVDLRAIRATGFH